MNESDETGFGPAKDLLAIYMLFDLSIFVCINCIYMLNLVKTLVLSKSIRIL